ncbi:AzlD domain-containing protein [Halobacteriovorax sp. HLS]|uniref:AzlD domain-containing protein n=1 Tax=Halobacteriovorax sp. HLS TaxID=2234000 RepID=UPI000FD8B5AB|nr:AzlD domain-containing protein [Halobacteriovorax sp. HLS]
MIRSVDFWIVVGFLSVGTLIIRSSVILLSNKFTFSDRAKEIFSFIPAAVIPAIIMPMVFFHKGEVDVLLGKERMLVLTFSAIICYLTKSMLITILFGLICLYLTLVFNSSF